MNLSAPVAAKRLGMSVSMFRRVAGDLRMVPVAWRHEPGKAAVVRIAYFSPEQVKQVSASFQKQVNRYAQATER